MVRVGDVAVDAAAVEEEVGMLDFIGDEGGTSFSLRAPVV
jgi:hypothetical protein